MPKLKKHEPPRLLLHFVPLHFAILLCIAFCVKRYYILHYKYYYIFLRKLLHFALQILLHFCFESYYILRYKYYYIFLRKLLHFASKVITFCVTNIITFCFESYYILRYYYILWQKLLHFVLPLYFVSVITI